MIARVGFVLAITLAGASGCVTWPPVAAPSPNGGCVQVTAHGRQKHYWKNGREVSFERLPAELADSDAAARMMRQSLRSRRASTISFAFGLGLIGAGVILGAVALGVHDEHFEAEAGTALGVAGAGIAIAAVGGTVAAVASDRQLLDAVTHYDDYAVTAGCRDPAP
ncbi:MAG TPA: hypothetical protein VGH63_01285 [Polyangia bacterium]